MAYVYRHIRLDKNDVFYVGISKNYEYNYARANNFSHFHRNKYWTSIFNKTQIEVEILFDNVSYDFARQKEIEFIDLYKRKCDGGSLCNITKGGEGVVGFKNIKLSERNKKGVWKGKKHTEETKLKMSERGKGRILSGEHRRKLSEKSRLRVKEKNANYRGVIYAYRGSDLVNQFDSLLDAAKSVNGVISMVSRVINGQVSTYRGLCFTRKRNLE